MSTAKLAHWNVASSFFDTRKRKEEFLASSSALSQPRLIVHFSSQNCVFDVLTHVDLFFPVMPTYWEDVCTLSTAHCRREYIDSAFVRHRQIHSTHVVVTWTKNTSLFKSRECTMSCINARRFLPQINGRHLFSRPIAIGETMVVNEPLVDKTSIDFFFFLTR